MTPVIFDFPQPSSLGNNIEKALGAGKGKITIRPFPDEETYLRVETKVKGRNVIINATLFHPNEWFLNLLFLADTLRAQGARQIILLAPYLAYMRQDKVFRPGEALTSATFAKLLSSHFDYLITVDPHLHRYHYLDEIYSIPTYVVKAAPLISQWIHTHIQDPFIIGPDEESGQWIKEIAKDFSYCVLSKKRFEDGHVEITWPKIEEIKTKNIVLVDDIISSGVTMYQSLKYLQEMGAHPPLCIAIHPIFSTHVYEKLLDSGATKIVTCNSVYHPSNGIDLTPLLVPALKHALKNLPL